mmetsp:Transcript_88711/g.286650  ORF Transcript_88711/g.286650 Transcript_88711/m.286650 type:complete len:80 (-) Transcript_88711:148-387(-)
MSSRRTKRKASAMCLTERLLAVSSPAGDADSAAAARGLSAGARRRREAVDQVFLDDVARHHIRHSWLPAGRRSPRFFRV